MDIVRDVVMRHAALGMEDLTGASATQLAASMGAGLPFAQAQGGPSNRALWFDVAYVNGRVDDDGQLAGFGYDLAALVVGGDFVEAGDATLGGYFAYGTSKMSEHAKVDQDFDGYGVHLGGYGNWALASGWSVSAAAGVMWGSQSTTRISPSVGPFQGGTAKADFDTMGAFLGGSASRPIAQEDGSIISPIFGLSYSWNQMDEVRETGTGDFIYAIDKSDAQSLIISAGADYLRPLNWQVGDGGGAWSFEGLARYEYDILANRRGAHEVTAHSPIFGDFTQMGQNRGAHHLQLGLGLNYTMSDTMRMAAGYGFGYNSNGTEHAIAANLRMRW